ncbi:MULTISPECIES: hypothetical protein [unclassified Streptomyces]|uniref:hypothetical protein n=1 Tax=unclassified Streptomyces TaxID=2593676 RepID=UPI0004CC126C|nr:MULTISPECIES: hypothetical protein [unclassified Streptomyces]KOV86106.1 hypothetical protein ADL02_19665 [Streptomyces sp. NRRL WC-3723]
MNGPQHYREGEQHLSAAECLDKPGGRPVDPTASAFHLMAAQAHFAAAQAAAAADQLADRYVGDGPHINEWRNAVSWLAPAEIVDGDAPTPGPRIPGKPYSPPVETALRNLNLAGHVTPADTLAAAIPVIAGHVAEALVDGESAEVRRWARSITDELKRIGLDLRGAVEYRVEDLNGGQPFSYDTPLGYSDEPPF